MRIIDWIGGLFRGRSGTIHIDTYRSAQNAIALEAFALFTTIEMIASLISKCEFKTYAKGKEIKGYEWVSLNVKPNKNQTSTEFWHEFVTKLLYYKEVLVLDVNGEKIIADDFSKTEYAIRETVFSNISRKDFVFNRSYTASEVFYLTYSNSDSQSIIDSIFAMYENLISSASKKYKKSGGEKGVLNVSAKAQGDPNFEVNFKKLMTNYFKSYFDNENAVLPLFDGFSYTASTSDAAKKYSNEISDIKTLVDEALARAAQAFKIQPALVKGDVAGIKDAIDMTLTVCIDPLCNMISEEFTGKEFTAKEIVEGNSIEADTSCIKHIDIFEIAGNAEKLISSGVLKPDETREKAGIKPTGEEWAQQHYMTKNFTTADMALKGGEN